MEFEGFKVAVVVSICLFAAFASFTALCAFVSVFLPSTEHRRQYSELFDLVGGIIFSIAAAFLSGLAWYAAHVW